MLALCVPLVRVCGNVSHVILFSFLFMVNTPLDKEREINIINQEIQLKVYSRFAWCCVSMELPCISHGDVKTVYRNYRLNIHVVAIHCVL